MSGAAWIWGIDPGINRCAFACAHAGSPWIDVETLTTSSNATEGERLGLLDRQLRIYGRQLAGRCPPAVIWVEQPSGRFQKPQLLYAVGVVQAALYEALEVPVFSIPSSKWKRWSVGVGNASKEQVRAWAERTTQGEVDDQDEADAIAIAYAGRAILTAGRWEAAA
jgi:Holliday junction resolvasome RuvABC endonuclease subunit